MMEDEIILRTELIQSLLTHTQAVMNHVFWFRHHLDLQPERPHVGSSINYTDIKCREDDFLRELICTIANWVYSKARAKAIVEERLSLTTNDPSNAYTFLTTQAFSKFRPGFPQGQFGELLLFNFVQHFFQAVPLLRKMRITTSIGHERFGSDAIHIKQDKNAMVFILGESKCYESKYQFNSAFNTSLTSIINSFNSLDKELNLYTYDDFIEPEIEDLAKRYKRGELRRVHFELVCLVAYNETKKINGGNEEEIKQSIHSIIYDRCQSLDSGMFRNIEPRILDRINYIIFPIWKLDELLDGFRKLIGV
jgi:hypothetical protein